jgi:predicted transposase YbfD/YdcC
MDYSILTKQIEEQKPAGHIEAHSLYAAFEQIIDGRKKRGVRYPLALLLTLIVLAKLSGEVTISGVVDWTRLRSEWLRSQFKEKYKRWPCFSTYTYALEKIDMQECVLIVAAALRRAEAQRRCEEEPSRLLTQNGQKQTQHVAFDGKALRGTNGHAAAHQPSVHLCAFYEVKTGILLAQRAVKEKENEISAVKEMLTPSLVKGRIISADAMHTQKEFCRTIKQYEGDYILIVKDNHPTMRADLELFFEDPEADRTFWKTATTVEKKHGRVTKRCITVSTDLREYFSKEWEGIEQVFRIERTVLSKGKTTKEVVYGFTSLSPKHADAEQLASIVRAHWCIENRSHWRRDVTLCEDSSQVRVLHVPAILAFLNSTILAIMDFLGVYNVPAQIRRYAANPEEALHLLIHQL